MLKGHTSPMPQIMPLDMYMQVQGELMAMKYVAAEYIYSTDLLE